ncbi:hypothetical protein LCGC14_2062100 [marine sediment metagenome]|uniref:Uncharacterized protein n=1 Tax=marine sediment metagenome TaxID=412755 RepID=A0A0F9HHT2_9ZZZZ
MSIDDGGPAFGGKQTQYRVYGDDPKALELAGQMAKAAEGQIRAIVISEEDSKRVGAFSLETSGMSLRDYYAGQAMQGLISGRPIAWGGVGDTKNEDWMKAWKDDQANISLAAYELADALIARKRETEKAGGSTIKRSEETK